MTRFFDELEAIPDPGPCFIIYGPHIPERHRCPECLERVDQPGWHVNPETREYECETP